MCPNPGGFDEEFYSASFKGRVSDKLAYVQGLHSSNLVSGDADEFLLNEECRHLPSVVF